MKPIYKSKMVWFNVIMLILGAAPIIAAQIKVIKPDWIPVVDGVVMMVTGIGNVILRVYFTDTPIDTPKSRARLNDQSGKVFLG